jgi:sterol desaturase/sphingolipid hydroxylase (fatty acid hydroxylase superfamily)
MNMKERLYRFRSFWIFPVFALALLYATSRHEPQERLRAFYWLFPLGLLLWTILEYTLHRFAFHIQLPIRNRKLREFLNASHLGHHAAPRDPTKVLVHPSFAIVVSAVLYGLIYAIAGNPFSAAAIMAGIWTGFLYYEAVHYRVHFSLSASGVVAWQRRAHFYHHFTNNKKCFGVTSGFWDYVFGTRRPILRPSSTSSG